MSSPNNAASPNNADLGLSSTPPYDNIPEYVESTETASIGSSNVDLNQSSFPPTTPTDNSEYAPITADEEGQLDPTISFVQHLSEGSEEIVLPDSENEAMLPQSGKLTCYTGDERPLTRLESRRLIRLRAEQQRAELVRTSSSSSDEAMPRHNYNLRPRTRRAHPPSGRDTPDPRSTSEIEVTVASSSSSMNSLPDIPRVEHPAKHRGPPAVEPSPRGSTAGPSSSRPLPESTTRDRPEEPVPGPSRRRGRAPENNTGECKRPRLHGSPGSDTDDTVILNSKEGESTPPEPSSDDE